MESGNLDVLVGKVPNSRLVEREKGLIRFLDGSVGPNLATT